MNLRWVPRNEDKGHRCPECHGIAEKAWDRSVAERGIGPRTVLSCPNDCGVKWRVGYRSKRRSMRSRDRAARWLAKVERRWQGS